MALDPSRTVRSDAPEHPEHRDERQNTDGDAPCEGLRHWSLSYHAIRLAARWPLTLRARSDRMPQSTPSTATNVRTRMGTRRARGSDIGACLITRLGLRRDGP